MWADRVKQSGAKAVWAYLNSDRDGNAVRMPKRSRGCWGRTKALTTTCLPIASRKAERLVAHELEGYRRARIVREKRPWKRCSSPAGCRDILGTRVITMLIPENGLPFPLCVSRTAQTGSQVSFAFEPRRGYRGCQWARQPRQPMIEEMPSGPPRTFRGTSDRDPPALAQGSRPLTDRALHCSVFYPRFQRDLARTRRHPIPGGGGGD